MLNKENLRQFTVAFTGHREIIHKDIPTRLDALLDTLCQQGFKFFRTGGALGFDTEAALAVLRAKGKYPHIKLILILPFPNQAEKWKLGEQAVYEEIKTKADKVTYTSEKYTRGCFHIRNRALVEWAGLCVAYLYKNDGGSAYTAGYAKQHGVRVINIAINNKKQPAEAVIIFGGFIFL